VTFTPMRCIDVTVRLNAMRSRDVDVDARFVEDLLVRGFTHVQFGTYVGRISCSNGVVENIENYQQVPA
jgi:hypothetical protein